MNSAAPEQPGRVASWAVALNMLALAAITIAMTPYTYLIDEIKITIFLCAGPVLMLAGLAALGLGQSPAPRRAVILGLAAYGLILGLSTLTSRYPWAGRLPCLFFWSAAGFFLTAFCAGASPRLAETYLRFLMLLLLGACVAGFLMYDLASSPDHHSFLGWVVTRIYPAPPSESSTFYAFLDTLRRADNTLQSTILNSSFFCGFCLFLLPFALLPALEPGPGRRRWLWRLAGIAAAALASLSALIVIGHLQQFLAAILSVALFCALALVTRPAGTGTRAPVIRFVVIVMIVFVALAALFAWFRKDWSARGPYMRWDFYRILWTGAWGIFKDHQILGGGPGTFAVYFSNYRSPDYYQFGINNVTTRAFNIFLDILSETGIFGLLAYLALLGILLVPAIRFLRRHPEPRLRGQLLAAATALIVILCYSLFDPFSLWIIGLAPLWSVMGLLAGLNARAGRAAEPAAPTPPSWRWAAAVVAALGLIVLPLSVLAGVNYFRSLKIYATGLSYLESASQWMQDDQNDPNKIQEYFKEATRYFDKTAELDKNNISVYYKAGSAWTSLNQIEARLAEEARKKFNFLTAGWHEAQSETYLKRAIEAYEALAARSPDYAEIHYNFGIVYHLAAQNAAQRAERAGDPSLKKEAEDLDRRALEHLLRMNQLSHKPEIALLAGGTLLEMGLNARALDLLKAASDREPRNGDLARKYLEAAQKAKDANAIERARARVNARKQEDKK